MLQRLERPKQLEVLLGELSRKAKLKTQMGVGMREAARGDLSRSKGKRLALSRGRNHRDQHDESCLRFECFLVGEQCEAMLRLYFLCKEDKVSCCEEAYTEGKIE